MKFRSFNFILLNYLSVYDYINETKKVLVIPRPLS